EGRSPFTSPADRGKAAGAQTRSVEVNRQAGSPQTTGKARAAAADGEARGQAGRTQARTQAGREKIRPATIRGAAEELGAQGNGAVARRAAAESAKRSGKAVLSAESTVGRSVDGQRARYGPPADRPVLERAVGSPRREGPCRRDPGCGRSRRHGAPGHHCRSGPDGRPILPRGCRKRAARLLQSALPAVAS